MIDAADVRDARWLDEQVAELGRGIEAARAIWANWFDLRKVGRLHPGLTAGQYIGSLGLRLTLPEALAAMHDASSRQVAAVAGVSHMTVARERSRVTDVTPVTGSDGKRYPRVVREVQAEIIEDGDENELDLTDVPTAAGDAAAQWFADLRRYLTSFDHIAPPPRIDPASFRRWRREVKVGIADLLDQVSRDG